MASADDVTLTDDLYDISGELNPQEETSAKIKVTPLVSACARFEVIDDEQLSAVADELGDDETPEDWFAAELIGYLGDVISERKLAFLDCTSGAYSDDLITEATRRANDAFADYGVRVAEFTELSITASDEDKEKLMAQLHADAVAAIAKNSDK